MLQMLLATTEIVLTIDNTKTASSLVFLEETTDKYMAGSGIRIRNRLSTGSHTELLFQNETCSECECEEEGLALSECTSCTEIGTV